MHVYHAVGIGIGYIMDGDTAVLDDYMPKQNV